LAFQLHNQRAETVKTTEGATMIATTLTTEERIELVRDAIRATSSRIDLPADERVLRIRFLADELDELRRQKHSQWLQSAR
jgi:hypothetical protein